MMQDFIQFLQKTLPLSEIEIAFSQEVVTIQAYKKGQVLLKEGQVSNAFYFNISGFVRLYYLEFTFR